MNVGELLRERDRLLTVIEEAKSARSKLKQVNVLIALYGDAEHVDLIKNDPVKANGKPKGEVECDECGDSFVGQRGLKTHQRTMHSGEAKTRAKGVKCAECGAGPFRGQAGLNMHNQRVHLGTVQTNSQKAKAS